MSKDGKTRKNSFAGDNERPSHANVGQAQSAKLLMAHVQNSIERSTLSANFYHSDVSCTSTNATSQDDMLLGFGHSEQQGECKFNAIKASYRHSRDQNFFLLDSGAP